MNEIPHIFIDCRRISLSNYEVSFRGFVEEFSRALNEFLLTVGAGGSSIHNFSSLIGV